MWMWESTLSFLLANKVAKPPLNHFHLAFLYLINEPFLIKQTMKSVEGSGATSHNNRTDNNNLAHSCLQEAIIKWL